MKIQNQKLPNNKAIYMPLKHVFPFHFRPNKNILVGVMCAREGVSGYELQHVNFNDDYMTTRNRQNIKRKKIGGFLKTP